MYRTPGGFREVSSSRNGGGLGGLMSPHIAVSDIRHLHVGRSKKKCAGAKQSASQ